MTKMFNIHATQKLSYKLGVLREGKIVRETSFRDNMITDVGLDNYGGGVGGNTYLLQQLTDCILGTNVSPTPVRRDGGIITFTQSTTTLTASAPFFLASDVGRLFKYGTGTAGAEYYITGYTSSTVVTVNTSATVGSPTAGVIHYVNTASLLTPISGLTWTKQSTGNSSAFLVIGSGVEVTHTCVNVSSALAASATVTEIAINNNTTNSNVYDRDLISPPVAMLAGDQAIVTIVLVVTYSPVTNTAAANVASGYDSSGDYLIESMKSLTGGACAIFNTNGSVQSDSGPGGGSGSLLEPASTAAFTQVLALTAAVTLNPFNASTMPAAGTSVVSSSKTLLAYGTGNRYRDLTASFSISQANGLIYGVAIGSTTARLWTLKFTSSFTKLNTQVLTFTFRRSFNRVLTN